MRYPRPVKRYSRIILRFPRNIFRKQLYPRSIKRYPRNFEIIRKKEFPPLYNLEKKPKDEFPELYKELDELRKKFLEKGRKTGIYCLHSKDHHVSDLAVCICRCRKKCSQLSIRNIAGPGEGASDVIDDFIKFQRLVNIIYGTVRKKDVNPKK